jgi:Domain of unknown function (DUF5753)
MGGLALPPCAVRAARPPAAAGLVVAEVLDLVVSSSRCDPVPEWLLGQVSGATTPSLGAWAGWWLGRATNAPRAAGGPAHISTRRSCVAVLAPEVSLWNHHGFTVFSDRAGDAEDLVHVETLQTGLNVRNTEDVARYLDAFERLAGMATTGDQARALLARLAGDLRAGS